MITISNDFIAGASNTASSCVQFMRAENAKSRQSFIVYACHNIVMISNVSESRVVCSLRGHDKRITCIKVIEYDESLLIVSGGDDCTIRLWIHNGLEEITKWYPSILTTMKGSINSVGTTCYGSLSLITFSDITGVVQVWLKNNENINTFSLIDTYSLSPSQLPCCLHLVAVPLTNSVLQLIGSVDSKIHIRMANFSQYMCFKTTPNLFKFCGFLCGHEEWITCLNSVQISPFQWFIASGSQDTKIRVWRLETNPNSSVSSTVYRSQGADSCNVSTVDSVSIGSEVNIINLEYDELEDCEDAEKSSAATSMNDYQDEIKNEARLNFKSSDGKLNYAIYLEALLIGHEDWITSVSWMSSHNDNMIVTNQLPPISMQLFSTSMDRNMCIWSLDELSGVWTPNVRVGDIGGQLGGSVGNNLLGFVGGAACGEEQLLLGVGYGGSLHLWSKGKDMGNGEKIEISVGKPNSGDDRWRPVPFLTGHYDSVNDLHWNESGQYFATVSSDQTCRVFAPIHPHRVHNVQSQETVSNRKTAQLNSLWKEVTRPQVHGYDLNSLVLIPIEDSVRSEETLNLSSKGLQHLKFGLPQFLISAGDEKIIRIFSPPAGVIEGLDKLCGIQSTGLKSSVDRAYIPELGLSNKAIDSMSSQEKSEMEARNVSALTWENAPLESQLSDHTIWPEERELFGHNNDVVCLAINHAHTLLVSSCKAKDYSTAKILMWNLKRNTCIGELAVHDSTVVTMRFSYDDKFLASSGKDRTLSLFTTILPAAQSSSSSSIAADILKLYELCTVKKNAHKRIVWDCSWAVNNEVLCTVSRDGFCKVWQVKQSGFIDAQSFSLECISSCTPYGGLSVTTIDILPTVFSIANQSSSDNQANSDMTAQSNSLLLICSEKGDISIWKMELSSGSMSKLQTVDDVFAHGSAVKRVRWSHAVQSSLVSPPLATASNKQSRETRVASRIPELMQSKSQHNLSFASCSEDHTVRVFKVEVLL